MLKKYSKPLKKALYCGMGMVSSVFLPSSVTDIKEAYAMFPIIVTVTQNLNFGSFSCNGASGTVVVPNIGARTVTGDVMALAGAGLEKPAGFNIIGSASVPIVLSVTTTNFTMANGTATLVVDDFNIVDTDATGSVDTVTMTTSSSSFTMGATLNVVCARPGGTYSGFYSIAANYL